MQHLRDARRRRPEHGAPAAGVRHRDDPRGPGRPGRAAVRPGGAHRCRLDPASEEQQACVEPVRDTDGFNWGYDPWHYTTPEGSYATDPEGPARTREFREMVAALNDAGPARRHGRRLQPHDRARPGPEVGARPDRARLLPPAVGDRCRRDVDVLLQHRDRARHDGEADGRLGGHLGDRLQGRRVPVRPDGPPQPSQHGGGARGARRAHRRERRRRRRAHLRLRRGLELRRGRRQRPVPAGQPARAVRRRHRHVQRPAARRRPRRRPVRRRPADPGLRVRSVHRAERRRRPTARPSEQRARLLLYHDQIKVGLAGNLRDYDVRRPHRRRR